MRERHCLVAGVSWVWRGEAEMGGFEDPVRPYELRWRDHRLKFAIDDRPR